MPSNYIWRACCLHRRTYRQRTASCISHCKPEIQLLQPKLLTISKIHCTAFFRQNAAKIVSLRGLNFCCLQSGHIFLFFTGAFQHGQTEAAYFEIDKIPLTVSSPRVISFAMLPPSNSQTNRRDRSDVGHHPLSDSSVLHSDNLLTRTPCSPLFTLKGHPQP